MVKVRWRWGFLIAEFGWMIQDLKPQKCRLKWDNCKNTRLFTAKSSQYVIWNFEFGDMILVSHHISPSNRAGCRGGEIVLRNYFWHSCPDWTSLALRRLPRLEARSTNKIHLHSLWWSFLFLPRHFQDLKAKDILFDGDVSPLDESKASAVSTPVIVLESPCDRGGQSGRAMTNTTESQTPCRTRQFTHLPFIDYARALVRRLLHCHFHMSALSPIPCHLIQRT